MSSLPLPTEDWSAPPPAQSVLPDSPIPEPDLPPPSKYPDDPNTCRQFIIQCQFTSNAQLSQYATDAAKIAYLANLLEGPPLSFLNALLEWYSPLDQSYTAFSAELKCVYDHPIQGQNAG